MADEQVDSNVTVEMEEIAQRTIYRVLSKPREFPRPIGLETYEPFPDDVVVTAFPKSGTTLTQQLTYQVVVATGGAPEHDPDGLQFDDICLAAPLIDMGPKYGFEINDSKPRVFKSHLVPQFFKTTVQKHILVLRDPIAHPASFLDFMFDIFAGEDVKDEKIRELAFHKFVKVRLLGYPLNKEGEDGEFQLNFEKGQKLSDEKNHDKLPVGPWFTYTKAWVNALRPGILVLFYEEMVKDISAAAHQVANFIGRELSKEGLEQVLKRVDRTYMANDPKFKCSLEAKVFGFQNAWKALPDNREGFKKFTVKQEDKDGINARFQQEFGVPDYKAFVQMVKEKSSQFKE